MDSCIENLKSTTFFGKRLTRKKIVEIQQTARMFSSLSRWELGKTICEHLNWLTPKGSYRIHACLRMLEQLEGFDILSLPPKNSSKQTSRSSKKIVWTKQTNPQPPINEHLELLTPISLQVAREKSAIELWNESIDRHHYLGYTRPFGHHLRYFIVDKKGRKLGALLFAGATVKLPCRDEWIGWQDQTYKKYRHLIVNNSRFLIFPWVTVKNLASKVLSIASQQIVEDWQTYYGFNPVLIETFVDLSKYDATCYRAANWVYLGKTNGRKPSKNVQGKTQKGVYVQPLTKKCKLILLKGPQSMKKPCRPKELTEQSLTSDDPFVNLWQNVIDIIVSVAEDYDSVWQKRQRVLNTLLVMLFIFRLVFSKNKEGYSVILVELWEQCRMLGINLPQRTPVAASAVCKARSKIDENIFKVLHSKILKQIKGSDILWKGHRIFAIDGSKINLPRSCINNGYRCPTKQSYYPQGLISCMYQLQSKIPFDFDLLDHENERKAAFNHINKLSENDIIVYDRGYYSYECLHEHILKGLHPVFRIKKKNNNIFDAFVNSDQTDSAVEIKANKNVLRALRLKYPQTQIKPYTLRLVKYKVAETTFILATTLLDQKKYSVKDLATLYYGRWGIEELYKISKQLMNIEDFHSKSERGVKQELFAHFILITLTRVFSNYCEESINTNNTKSKKSNSNMQTNFKNNLMVVSRSIEALLLQQETTIRKTINYIINSISSCRQSLRPGRSYKRQSRKPIQKWKPART